mmetsp:Transcript_64415/g.155760  ORF Transcript_64415/g.155760 Transcript_64415/m.155760 type:complete len:94 (-) Transcript_64415:167-448(-)
MGPRPRCCQEPPPGSPRRLESRETLEGDPRFPKEAVWSRHSGLSISMVGVTNMLDDRCWEVASSSCGRPGPGGGRPEAAAREGRHSRSCSPCK